VNEFAAPTFWERLAARSQASAALASIEDPITVVRIVTVAFWSAAAIASLAALSMFWYDEAAAGWSLAALAVSFAVGWAVYATGGGTAAPAVIIVVTAAANDTFVHIALGGYAYSGAMLMWAITLTLTAAVMLPRNVTLGVAVFFIVQAIVFAFMESSLQASRAAPDPALTAQLFAIVLVGTLLIVTPLFVLILGRLSHERERAEGLLLNVLPAEVAAELKETGHTTARRYESISVLFADIVGFTPLSAEMDPEAMVGQLNTVFTHFDQLANKFGCEKIRTIGDGYMVAAGVPVPRDDHAYALASMALEMLDYAKTGPLSFRLGINSGPVVAGVVGISKFQYDLWGDTVNIASRMESHGEPDRIQISEATYRLIKDDFNTTLRGPIEVKGKGTLTTWYLEPTPEPATAATL
jgi:guanylate cyclase